MAETKNLFKNFFQKILIRKDPDEMLKEAGMDDKVLKLRSLEAFEAASNGQATKIIIPSDIQNLAGVVSAVTEIAKK